MPADSPFWPTLIVCLVFAFAACKHSSPLGIEKLVLSDSARKRQIEILKSIHSNEIEGKKVTDFPELFSLADEIVSKNGKIVQYVFLRKGEGGNDDGTDSSAHIEVQNGVVQRYFMLVVPS